MYKNTGSGFIEDTSISLPGVQYSSVAWSDYNGDGKPDFLLTGLDSSLYPSISKLYKNTGSGFIEDTSISLPGVAGGSVIWADYNGDGKQDFLLTGNDNSYTPLSKLYKNTGGGFIEDTSISLPGVRSSSVAWSDYNGDSKPDLLLTGESGSGIISKLYKNTGSDFTEDTSISLPGVDRSSVAWADYTGDGKPDFLLTGEDSSYNHISKLYKNTGSGFTEDTSIVLPGVYEGSVAWSDYNGDGKPDLLLTGVNSSYNQISKLYKNTGSGFTQDTSISLAAVRIGSVAWSDYTGDGKPDFLLTGDDVPSDSVTSKLYENTTTTSDTTPPKASSFTPGDNSTIVGVDANLVLNFSEAIQKGTGNIVIKKLSDNSVVETIAVTATNVIVNGNQLTINPTANLAEGVDYYVEIANGAIQDIAGNNYAGITGNSTWNFKAQAVNFFTKDPSISLPGVSAGSVAWSDYNGDGKQDLLLTGQDNSGNQISKLYKNTGSGFTQDTSISLPGVTWGSVTWSDYNGDGKPDFLLTGLSDSGGKISKLYKNTGSGFSEDTSISLPGVYGGSVAWADYNGDGKQDLLLTGEDNSNNSISKLYKNTGTGFTEDTNISLPGVWAGSVAWSDYNGDGKQDFLLTSYDNSGSISKLYKNTGSGFTEDTSISLPGVGGGSVAWADYTGDGKPDFLLTGSDNSNNHISKLYKNTGSGFTEDTSISLPGVDRGSVAWFDYSGDGKPDLLLTGLDNSYNQISKLYKNTGSGFSEDPSIVLPDVYLSSVAWSNYSGDGKPGFLLTGQDGYNSISQLYKYSTTTSDTTPPKASSFTPGDNSIIVAVDANLVVNFSEAIKKGTGNIVIKKLSDNSVVETIAVTATNVILNGNQLTINPTANLAQGTDYYVEIANGAIKDLAGNNYGGITGNSTWNFKTEGFPPINGTANNDILTGTVHPEIINGLGGNDQLFGNAGNDSLNGGDGIDTLNGGAGNDLLKGNAGNDIYIVDSAGDIVTELAAEGTDLVQSSITYTLPANVENLTLTGTTAINGTGNALANVITGNTANNILKGGAGNDTYVVDNAGDLVTELASEGTDLIQSSVTYTLPANVENLTLTGTTAINGTGNALVNTIIGNTANNILNGGIGGDQLKGSTGNDTYVVDNAGDIVTELASGGTDLIQSSVTYTLPGEVENLTLTGTTAINGTGNALANIITGNTANNILTGGAGNDTYVVANAGDIVTELASGGTDLIQSSVTYTLPVEVENLTLTGTTAINGTGNALANIITGNTANNILTGGAGNDTYVVDNAGDIVTELASGGTDLVQSSVTYTLPVEVENLTLTGTTAINGTGNALANIITGNTANNILNGSSGADQLKGSTGNDTYVVDNAGDIVTELASGGTDLIQSSVTYTLPGEVENLTLTGTTAINGTGNTLANIITGNTANNILNGSTGNDNLIGSSGADQLLGGDGNDSLSGDAANDTLTGGLGADKFIYNTNAAFATSAVGVDSITDFTIAQGDLIVLDKTTFTSISSIAGTGFSVATEFAKVTTDALAATSAADIVYNTATGGLFYNQNGTAAGFGTGTQFLTLTTKPALTATQFVIQA
uniref:Mannuronan C5-epimerase AlgE3 n=1 Tax=Planktothrix pseudagardhii TaxID=132604 RepID=A0A9W4CQV3_9CYAN|nr:Mannuronan C5-epimerase AlgE3 [Planktothrix pseudagardhii]